MRINLKFTKWSKLEVSTSQYSYNVHYSLDPKCSKTPIPQFKPASILSIISPERTTNRSPTKNNSRKHTFAAIVFYKGWLLKMPC